MLNKFKEMVGKNYECGIVMSVFRGGRGETQAKCLCKYCRKEFIATASSVLLGKRKSCGCRQYRPNNKEYLGVPENTYWNTVRKAKYRNIECTISLYDLGEQYEKQGRMCALTGLPIGFTLRSKQKNSASLDRIDNTKGYVPGNIQWVYKPLNFIKGQLTEEEFLNYVKLIYNWRNLCQT